MSVHDKAVQLMRLLVADHPFVDGNERTALRTVGVFYMLTRYAFEEGDESLPSYDDFSPEST